MYPDDCVQSIIHPNHWWVANEHKQLCRGALVFAFLPHIDQVPYTVKPVGRVQADQHDTAEIKIEPLRIRQPRKQTELPVAAMPLHAGELWAAYRAKKRPGLVVSANHNPIDRKLTKGMPNRFTAPTILACPYFGADQDGKRSGYSPQFVERVRHCEYPQFFWDKLPIDGPQESILRLDQIQPVGTHHNSYQLSAFKLSDDALEVIDELIQWQIWGGVRADSLIALYRQEIESFFEEN